jgi:homoserine dehydrogenase
MHYNLAFIGFGNVARSLARLLERKSDLLKSKYDITYSVTDREGATACGVPNGPMSQSP